MVNITIGEEMKKFRKVNDLTQYELSVLANVPQTNISMIERGIRTSTDREYDAISKLISEGSEELSILKENKKIGNNLKILIGMSGLTETKFAKVCGLTRTTVCRIENGRIDLNKNTRIREKLLSSRLFTEKELFDMNEYIKFDKRIDEVKKEFDVEEDRFVNRISSKVATSIIDRVEETLIGYLDGENSSDPFSGEYAEIKKVIGKLIHDGIPEADITTSQNKLINKWVKEYIND